MHEVHFPAPYILYYKACPHLLRKAVHSSLHHTGNTVTSRTARVSSLHIQAFGHETGNRQQSKVPLLYKNTDGLRHDIHKNHCSRKQPLPYPSARMVSDHKTSTYSSGKLLYQSTHRRYFPYNIYRTKYVLPHSKDSCSSG